MSNSNLIFAAVITIIKSLFFLYFHMLNTQEAINQKFFKACKLDNFEEVKYLLTSPQLPIKAQINAKDSNCLTLLCHSNPMNIELLKYLLSSPDLSEHVNLAGRAGTKLLDIACIFEQLDLIDYILASPDIATHASFGDEHNSHGFLSACEGEREHVIEHLIAHHLDKIAPDTIQCVLTNTGVAVGQFSTSIQDFVRANIEQKKLSDNLKAGKTPLSSNFKI